ncbi:hypothetical protein SGRA_3449 [Saprospira grandis str. Lewin]|uniref:Uncharacterized protein n=1 Tax=Saprospira grandis (strain Lewin) TaxID=984262 RepID=H6L1U6_SAPGL|nr:hypothetical protein SGRA_3449 [Saprospira grandis str. Lewin]
MAFLVTIFQILFFWGLPPSAAGPLQGSQVCSALRRLRLLGLPLRGPLSGP